MDCTNYNEAIGYNEPISYNGVCVAPPVSAVVGGGYVRHDYQLERLKKKKHDDEISLIIALLELDDD